MITGSDMINENAQIGEELASIARRYVRRILSAEDSSLIEEMLGISEDAVQA